MELYTHTHTHALNFLLKMITMHIWRGCNLHRILSIFLQRESAIIMMVGHFLKRNQSSRTSYLPTHTFSPDSLYLQSKFLFVFVFAVSRGKAKQSRKGKEIPRDTCRDIPPYLVLLNIPFVWHKNKGIFPPSSPFSFPIPR